MVRCLPNDSGLPRSMWGELFPTAAYLANRSPHSALDSQTPYFKFHGKQAGMSALRTIGARAFVHVETHTPKLEDRAWEGRLVGYSSNSKAYRIYNGSTQRVVENRNVTFIETPPQNIQAVERLTDKD